MTAKNATVLAGRQASDVVMFGVLPPFAEHGADAAERQTRAWFDPYAGEIGYDVTDLAVAVAGHLGVCSFLYHVSGTIQRGDSLDMWVRATLACRWVNDAWEIFHDHESVPFDPSTGQAVLSIDRDQT